MKAISEGSTARMLGMFLANRQHDEMAEFLNGYFEEIASWPTNCKEQQMYALYKLLSPTTRAELERLGN